MARGCGGVSDSVPPVRAAIGPAAAPVLRRGQLPCRPRHHDGAPEPSSTGGGGDRRIPAARHRRVRARHRAHPARRLLEDEGPRHRRAGPHREPGSRCYDPPPIPTSAASGWSTATSSCPRPRRPAAKKTRTRAAPTMGRNSFPSRTRSWRASRRFEGSGADDPGKRVFRLQVRAVYSLDRVAIEPKGPRFIETLHVRDMLPEFQTD